MWEKFHTRASCTGQPGTIMVSTGWQNGRGWERETDRQRRGIHVLGKSRSEDMRAVRNGLR